MKKIKILGYDYTIHYSPLVENGGMTEAARCCVGKQVILLDPEQAKQTQESGVLHEIIEALNYSLELQLPHNVIQSLEAGLYAALTDNGVKLSVLIK